MKGLGSALWFSRYPILALLSSATALEGAAPDAVSGDLGEKALDHVKPGGRGRREVQMEAGMRCDPALHGCGLVSGIVINDKMEIETRWGLLFDQPEKMQELAMSMARQATPITCSS
jgi:hypothetical protein